MPNIQNRLNHKRHLSNEYKALLMLADEHQAKEIYQSDFKADIINAQYSPEIEEGILQMCEDLISGRLQIKIHATKNLHAKFYLCLPQNHSAHSDGWVIMGSSNIYCLSAKKISAFSVGQNTEK